MLIFRDSKHSHMHDHAVLQIISEHAPPFATDSQMIEWSTCISNHMHKGMEAKLAKEAQQACKDDYKCFLTVAQMQHENNQVQV